MALTVNRKIWQEVTPGCMKNLGWNTFCQVDLYLWKMTEDVIITITACSLPYLNGTNWRTIINFKGPRQNTKMAEIVPFRAGSRTWYFPITKCVSQPLFLDCAMVKWLDCLLIPLTVFAKSFAVETWQTPLVVMNAHAPRDRKEWCNFSGLM
jgi:hypothetical protein